MKEPTLFLNPKPSHGPLVQGRPSFQKTRSTVEKTNSRKNKHISPQLNLPFQETIDVAACSNPDVFGPVSWTSFEVFCRIYRRYYQIHVQKSKQESFGKPQHTVKMKIKNLVINPSNSSPFATNEQHSFKNETEQKKNLPFESSIVQEKKWQNVTEQPTETAILETNQKLKKFLLTHTIPFRKWFENSILAIPCPTCRTHALDHLSKHPFKFDTPQLLERSLLDLYNSVQKKLNLPEWSMKQWKIKCKTHWNAQKVDFYFFVSKHSPFHPQVAQMALRNVLGKEEKHSLQKEERRENQDTKTKTEAFVHNVSKKELYEEFLLQLKSNPSYRSFVSWNKKEKKSIEATLVSPTGCDSNSNRKAKYNLKWALSVPGWVRLLFMEHAWLVVGQYPQNPNPADQVLMRQWLEVTLKFGFYMPSLEKEKNQLLQRVDYSKKVAVSSAILEFYNLYSKFDLSFSPEGLKTASRQNLENFERTRASCFYILFDEKTIRIPPSHIVPVSSSFFTPSPLPLPLLFYSSSPKLEKGSFVQETETETELKETTPSPLKTTTPSPCELDQKNISDLNIHHQEEEKKKIQHDNGKTIIPNTQLNLQKKKEKEASFTTQQEERNYEKTESDANATVAMNCFQNPLLQTEMLSWNLFQKFFVILFCLLFLLLFRKLLS